ncbi:hypothetical protein ABEB36_009432 [Hypothenemus hampei]|uniref:Uncharacterized protein n=1 Tax=Hypothenemus hampei TaxID=57062 RepID=A0ABD1EGF4_HYPHA
MMTCQQKETEIQNYEEINANSDVIIFDLNDDDAVLIFPKIDAQINIIEEPDRNNNVNIPVEDSSLQEEPSAFHLQDQNIEVELKSKKKEDMPMEVET